jgi:hypothetical protein
LSINLRQLTANKNLSTIVFNLSTPIFRLQKILPPSVYSPVMYSKLSLQVCSPLDVSDSNFTMN